MKVDTRKIVYDGRYCKRVFEYFLKKKVIKEDRSKLFQKYMNKALSNLEFANFILEEHEHSIKEKLPKKTFYDWCIIIYYYAIYHTALALIKKLGYESKNHLVTISAITLFYYHRDNILKREEIEFLIEKIHIEKEEIDFVLDAKELRERACYGADELFELKQAKSLQREAVNFVNKIRVLIES